MSETVKADRFLSQRETAHVTGLSRITMWRERRRRAFPEARRISPGRIGYLESEIQAWIQSRTRCSEPDGAKPPPAPPPGRRGRRRRRNRDT